MGRGRMSSAEGARTDAPEPGIGPAHPIGKWGLERGQSRLLKNANYMHILITVLHIFVA